MDVDAEKQKIQDEERFIQAWLEHPITKGLVQDNEEQQQSLITLITQNAVTGDESLYALIEAKGHLRGLRRFRGLVDDQLESVKRQLEEVIE